MFPSCGFSVISWPIGQLLSYFLLYRVCFMVNLLLHGMRSLYCEHSISHIYSLKYLSKANHLLWISDLENDMCLDGCVNLSFPEFFLVHRHRHKNGKAGLLVRTARLRKSSFSFIDTYILY